MPSREIDLRDVMVTQHRIPGNRNQARVFLHPAIAIPTKHSKHRQRRARYVNEIKLLQKHDRRYLRDMPRYSVYIRHIGVIWIS